MSADPVMIIPDGLRQQLRAALRHGLTERALVSLYRAEALDLAGANKCKAARLLRVNRRTLYRAAPHLVTLAASGLGVEPAALESALDAVSYDPEPEPFSSYHCTDCPAWWTSRGARPECPVCGQAGAEIPTMPLPRFGPLEMRRTRRAPQPSPEPAPPAQEETHGMRMQIHSFDRRECPDLPEFVEWHPTERDRAQAERNHSQTLERLNERGGLAWDELRAVLLGQRYSPRRVRDAQRDVAAELEWRLAHARAQYGPPPAPPAAVSEGQGEP